MTPPPPDVVLYSRAGCGLCDEARETLELLLRERSRAGQPAPALIVRDIAADPALERAVFDRIPVVEVDGHRLELTSSPARLRRLLDAAISTDLAAPTPR